MMPHNALRLTSWIAGLSITIIILGLVSALFVWQASTTSPVKIAGVLALGVLWITNLLSLLLNAVYWFIRRWPKLLVVVLIIQVAIAVLGVLVALR